MIQSVPRALLPPGAWDRFVASRPDGWWFHLETWIAYALAYSDGATDHSAALADGDLVVAVAPSVHGLSGAATNGGQRQAAPVVGDGEFTVQVGGQAGAGMAWRPGAVVRVRTQPGFMLGSTRTLVLDLARQEQELWRGVRRSYHSLVHRAERTYDISAHSHVAPGIASTLLCRARELHAEASGRETRPVATWMLQADWLFAGNGVLVVATRGGAWRGFAYGLRWKDWAYYFSSATLDEDLNHALLWSLIRTMRADGVTRHFELGEVPPDTAPEKERNVAFFKSGWGAREWPVPVVEATCG